ncbi:MAG: class I SAM-dependent methyltransferase [Sulfurimicrobium sp.]|jgi:SAM-dependent methyltransferase|nr:class I SAM-dependent methyltransferase [Sulfurimicrobium sp.]MDP1706127.1 class I SAM-dependent methyltransferase [Sulfurimicrobium sp.]MDP2199857.1 class I SAM-dependent methyltransferase [Sulfurimicrobium sp.]MDP2962324.1 class I SAM-dependent methyltransferase [Sulfurimicrobium sp.]MDP3687498.1 class I SAM-dependent methyltransferase [Sulfurimicrobium sp.]
MGERNHMDACRICGNEQGNKLHEVREMMYGLREAFEYIECANCGCLQIRTIPNDLSKYYPEGYWGFQKKRMAMEVQEGTLSAWLRRRRTQYWLSTSRDPIGRLIAMKHEIPRHITWVRRAGLTSLNAPILDVGCGLGDRLRTLRHEGFANLTGVDPFIEKDINYPNGIRIRKSSLYDVNGKFDFITLHHSFEHMPDPRAVLEKLHTLLNAQSVVLVRIPVADSYAWHNYGVHWAQIDAPRHFYLHTVKSMQHLAEQTGFDIVDVAYDSYEFQFWGSEQYKHDIPLYDELSYETHPEHCMFTAEQINAFQVRAREFNLSGEGDQACFYLRKRLFKT